MPRRSGRTVNTRTTSSSNQTDEQTHPLLFSPSTLYTPHDDLCPTTTNVDHLRSIWNVALGRDVPARKTEIERDGERERTVYVTDRNRGVATFSRKDRVARRQRQ